ncbi:hypothetical protein Tco_0054449, partial [Tanacetum coccineum]
RHTPVPSEPAGHEESSSLYAELGLYGSDTESDEEMPSVVRSGAQDKGQAGPDPSKLDEGQAGPDPDVEITDPFSQPQPEHMDEGFTTAAYPDIQENLKLTANEQVIPEEPVSSTGTLTSLQHLAKDFSFGDQFLNDKSSEADNEKTMADTEADSMVSVTIQQDTSVIPPMTSPVIDPVPRPDSPNEIDRKINESVKEVVISSVKHAMRAPLHARFKDLPTSDKKEILLQRMLEENYDKGHVDHREKTKKKSKQDSPKTPPGLPPSPPPPPPPPSGASGASGTTGASDSAQAPPSPPPSLSSHQGDQSTSTVAPSSSKTVASAESMVSITIQQKSQHPSDMKVLTMKIEILLEPTSNKLLEILLKMNLPDHRIKLWWKWRYLVPVESIHSPMLTLNVFNQRHHDNQKTYNTASATLIRLMEMEHYLEYIDNEVWKVIQNGNSKKRISTGKDGIVRVLSPVTAAEIQAVGKRNERLRISC